MKTFLPFFVALVAFIVHATPTVQNQNRMVSSQASDSLEKRAGQCIPQCGTPKPYCRTCPDLYFWGACVTPHGITCGYSDALPSDKDCPRGSWGCIANCCKD
ncbi:hypothetical protein K443DRAFT_686981 [Laccaria amethystina LaAM-08-1]|uniref:Uncharacterized protein n=1 Tax=Laccaria amethystina LaAM-08-1 TaxID=1095629 RepID=A0A0C9WL80_9AGAR|nr:hypothetical protein K443DRAFT_686981 [Laccaria amethystina LaAM-08-1]